jgi:hypothetical protein|tara:strand:+ start:4445 stop:4954 length:510 start_codon:yes stop_codon:yes gene_type:complete
MSKSKLGREELERLLEEGKTYTEIAKIGGVSVAAISKRMKKIEIQRHLPKAVIKKAEKLVTGNLNLMEEINELVQDLKNTVENINNEISNINGKERDQKRLLKLNHISELRAIIKTLVDVGKIISDVNEIKFFQEMVISEIAKEEPAVARRIVKKLSERATLRGVIERA